MCIPSHLTPAWRSPNAIILRWVHPGGADALPGISGSGALKSEGRWMDGWMDGWMDAEKMGAGR